MTEERYFVVNVNTGEKIQVLPHSAGDTTDSPEIPDESFGFAKAELAGTPEWEKPEVMFWFENMNKDGEFAKPESTQLDITGEWDFVTETQEVNPDESQG